MAADAPDLEFGNDRLSIASTLSWNTQITRTRITTEKGLSSGVDAGIENLNDILQAVKRLDLPRYNLNTFEDTTDIGEGESFQVKRSFHKGRAIAVKYLKIGQSSDGHNRLSRRLASVLLEIKIMQHTPLRSNPHILSILGYGWNSLEGSTYPYLVVEFGNLGALRDYLRGEKKIPFSYKRVFCGDMAAGLMALHACQIVHGDLKLDNVVVFSSWDRPSGALVKICDFGHSILPYTGGTSKYYGTPLYNPPEAFKQDEVPIEKGELFKCDIWAFGLAIWEIIKDGSLFFERSWRSNPKYFDTKMKSISIQTDGHDNYTNESTPFFGEYTRSIDPVKEDIHGRFDLCHLRGLARDFIRQLKSEDITAFDKGYLTPLLSKCLSIDPAKRVPNILKTPVMTSWNTVNEDGVRASLAIHTGSSELTFEIFRTDTDEIFEWEHQRDMLRDLEATVDHSKPGVQATIISKVAFQIAICYINGFGTAIDMTKATRYLRKAKENSHPLGSLISKLIGVTVPELSDSGLPFSKIVTQLQAGGRTFEKSFNDALFSFDSRTNISNRPKEGYKAFISWVENYIQSMRCCDLKVIPETSENKEALNILELAIAFGESELVDKLNFDLNARGAFGETPLVQAARTGSGKLVRSLILKGADPNIGAEDGTNILHWLFCIEDDLINITPLLKARIKFSLIEQKKATVRTIHSQWPLFLNGTPLSFAVTVGSKESVKTLLELGADPMLPAYFGKVEENFRSVTPLHIALKYHMNDIWTLLLHNTSYKQSGCLDKVSRSLTLELQTHLGKATPIERLAVHGREYNDQLTKFLSIMPLKMIELPSANGQTVLIQAIENNDINLLKSLLAKYPQLARHYFRDPASDKIYTTPFHFAAQIGSFCDAEDAAGVVSCLLFYHPSGLLSKDDLQRTCLHLAVTGPYPRLARWILYEGSVDVHSQDSMGRTALHVSGSVENLQLILEAGANIDRKSNGGITPLHTKILLGQVDQAIELIDRGANVNSMSRLGNVLHCAVKRELRSIIVLLIAKGAMLNRLGPNNLTATHIATQLQRRDILQLLIDAGALLYLRNSDNCSCLDIALASNDQSIVQMVTKACFAQGPQRKWFTITIHNLCNQGDYHSIQTLLTTSYNDNAHTDPNFFWRGQTALHIAAQTHRADIAKLLLRFGADPNLNSKDGNTPLEEALNMRLNDILVKRGDRLDFIETLIDHGANVGLLDGSHWLWNSAVETKDFALIELMFEKQINPSKEHLHFLFDRTTMIQAMSTNKWKFVVTCIRHDYCDVFTLLNNDPVKILVIKIAATENRVDMIKHMIRNFNPQPSSASFQSVLLHNEYSEMGYIIAEEILKEGTMILSFLTKSDQKKFLKLTEVKRDSIVHFLKSR